MTNRNWRYFLGIALVSLCAAVGNAGLIYVVNKVVRDYFGDNGHNNASYVLYFFLALAVFISCRWLVAYNIIKFAQRELEKARMGVLKMTLRSTFGFISKNKSRMISAITKDTDNIVNASIYSVDVLTSIMMVIICFTYMAILSWKLLLFMAGVILVAVAVYIYSIRIARGLFKTAMAGNDTFVRYFNDILHGFKEVVLEPEKGRAITRIHLGPTVRSVSAANEKAHMRYLSNRVIGQVAFYLFIALTLFVLSDGLHLDKGVRVNCIFLSLYIWGPIETAVVLMPYLTQARVSVRRIEELQDVGADDSDAGDMAPDPAGFQRIEFRKLEYRYDTGEGTMGGQSFAIGPVDLTIERGEVVFIAGGNGGGKTTLVNLITGILAPGEGEIIINGDIVCSDRPQTYRALFAPVFSDFYLFDQLYGVPEIDLERAREYIKLFEIDHKVSIGPMGFSDINLSMGQRKRLALVGAMLEKKPILVLDEFAADQDPWFKKKFYEHIIPYLKEAGFAVVAITHDESYFMVADKFYNMEYGKIDGSYLNRRSMEMDIQTL